MSFHLISNPAHLRGLYAFGFVAAQLLVALVAFGPLSFPGRDALLTGFADCEIALAVVVLVSSSWRWTVRVPVVFVLLLQAWAGHYVYIVTKSYPYVYAEEYLISPCIGVALFTAFCVLKGCSRLVPEIAPKGLPMPTSSSPLRFTIQDLLIWTFGIAIVLSIGRRAMSLTDVGGIMDPWESIHFERMPHWDFILPRLPVLLLALVLYGAVWAWVVRILLTTKRWTCLPLMSVFLSFLGLTLGEVAVSSCMIFQKEPWPLLPASMMHGYSLIEPV